MFWDGTRWIQEGAPAATPPPTRRRGREWLATGVIIVAFGALAMPLVASSDGSSSGDRPIASSSAQKSAPPTNTTPVLLGLAGAALITTPTEVPTPTPVPIPIATPITPSVTTPVTTPTPVPIPIATPITPSVTTPVTTPTPAPSARPTPKAAPGSAGFLSRSGTTLTLNGSPHRLIGINMYTALWADYPYRNDLATALPQLSGVNTVRVFAFQASAIKDGVRDWSSWDASLALFAQYGVKVIMVLTDQWGGQPVTDSLTERTISWYRTGYKTTVEGVSIYRDWVAEAVTRYRDNPTIGIWQLVNEGEARNADGSCSEATAAAALRSFTDDVGGLVKAIDPNHLVSLGTISGECGSNEADYGNIYASGPIDLCDYHDYGFATSPMGNRDLNNGLQVSLDRCHAAGKALFVGEIGIPFLSLSPGTTAERAKLFDAKFAAQFAAGSVGEVAWCWSNSFSAVPPRDMEITPGDPTQAFLTSY